jgi:putative ABC transport system substrate-binding protein
VNVIALASPGVVVAGALALLILLWPLAAEAQPPAKTGRLGYLTGPGSLHGGFAIALREFALRELGWVEGENLVVERRSAGDRPEQLREFAAELVQGRPAVIVAEGLVAALAAKAVTRSVPIVFAIAGDPVAGGLVQSLARPGGNLTGITTFSGSLAAKRLQLIAEVLPAASRIGVLWNAANPEMEGEWRHTQAAARQTRTALVSLAVRTASEVPLAIDAAAQQRLGGVVVLADALMIAAAPDLVDGLSRRRIPAIYGHRVFVSGETARDPGKAAGLMSFAPTMTELARAGASYVDRILKGARPADLPVQQPASFELVVSSRAARAIGLTLPPSLLLRADVVLE